MHICIDKSARLRVIIPAVEIIHPCFGIKVITSIPEWIENSNAIDIHCNGMVTPCVILILCLFVSIPIIYRRDISLQILFIIISYIIIFEPAYAAIIIVIPYRASRSCLTQNSASVKLIGRRTLSYAQTARIIRKREQRITVNPVALQLPDLPPSQRMAAVCRRIAQRIIGDGLSVEARQSVFPAGRSIGICFRVKDRSERARGIVYIFCSIMSR